MAKRWLVPVSAVSAVVALLALLAACTPGERPAPGPAAVAGTTQTVNLGDRPFQLRVPPAYRADARMPLVVLLHGFQSNGAQQEGYFKLTAEADRRGFLYAVPDGSQNRQGNRFWNATAACCDFGGTGVDDVAYLGKLIDTVKASYSVDAQRVYLVGHSNGGFMAYRMACDHAAYITAIVSLAGAMTNEATQCAPARPVSVLQIHGTNDATIRFDGGANAGRPYPSVATTLAFWQRHNGCTGPAETAAAPLDLDSKLAGAETTVTTHRAGCRDATRVELWTIQDGGHIPALSSGFASAVAGFLLDRVSPA